MKDQPAGGHVFNMDGAGADGNATPRFAAYGATKRSLQQVGMCVCVCVCARAVVARAVVARAVVVRGVRAPWLTAQPRPPTTPHRPAPPPPRA
jgi:hypothetical protein